MTIPRSPVNQTGLGEDKRGDFEDAADLFFVAGCGAVQNADRYRFRMMILGIETQYSLVASSTEPLATIKKNVLPGQTVQIIVQAVSGNLQSVPSEPIVFTVPFAAKTEATAEATGPAEHTVPLSSVSPDGHTNGARLPALS